MMEECNGQPIQMLTDRNSLEEDTDVSDRNRESESWSSINRLVFLVLASFSSRKNTKAWETLIITYIK